MENSLPDGWIRVELQTIAAKTKYPIGDGDHGQIKPSMYRDSGIPYIRVSDMGWGEFKPENLVFIDEETHKRNLKSELVPGDVLIAKTGATIGKCCIVPDTIIKANTTSSVGKITLETNIVNPKWVLLFFLTREFKEFMWSISERTAQPGFNIRDMVMFKIPLPPKSEQDRILKLLDEIMAKIKVNRRRLERIPHLLKHFRQSVLTAAVSGKLTEDWRELRGDELENGEDILHKIRNTNAKYLIKKKITYPSESYEQLVLPDTWARCTWNDYLDHSDSPFRRGPFGSALKKEVFVDKGYKVYEQYCPINDDCSFGRYYINEEKFAKLKQFEVKAGDFLISCSGVTLGRITQVPECSERGIINQALLRVRVYQRYILDKFFILLFRSPEFQKSLFERSTGSAIPNLKGVDELKAIPVPLLSYEEQLEIVRRIEKLFERANRMEVRYNSCKSKFDKMSQAILQKAFCGELVPQNPEDELASVLLGKIKTNRVVGKSKR
jgi:type I restriction enzyme, S subunit